MIKTYRLAPVLALLLALVMLFSVLYIALEADHDCCGEDCGVCVLLHACEDLLRNLLAAVLLLSAACCLGTVLTIAAAPVCRPERPHSLILLKVKLSN